MPYRLRIDRTQQLVLDSLPQPASEALTLALAGVCDDPIGATDPYGDDDGVMRLLVLPMIVTVLLVIDATKNVHVMQITYQG